MHCFHSVMLRRGGGGGGSEVSVIMTLRGHLQTDFGTLNDNDVKGGRGVQPMTLLIFIKAVIV